MTLTESECAIAPESPERLRGCARTLPHHQPSAPVQSVLSLTHVLPPSHLPSPLSHIHPSAQSPPQNVVPLVWAHPDGEKIRFTLVGSIPQREAGWSPLAQEDPRVLSTGRVRDMDPFLNAARVFVSPIVVGTGLNVKNLVALEYGLPLVTTVIGAEGLRLVEVGTGQAGDGGSVRARAMVATDPQGMADAIVMLHQNRVRHLTRAVAPAGD